MAEKRIQLLAAAIHGIVFESLRAEHTEVTPVWKQDLKEALWRPRTALSRARRSACRLTQRRQAPNQPPGQAGLMAPATASHLP